jgi:hypothetical protein
VRYRRGVTDREIIDDYAAPIVAAEVFSATHPNSNRKLQKEIARLADDPSRHRYVFFAAPGYIPGRQEQLEKPVTLVQVYAAEP